MVTMPIWAFAVVLLSLFGCGWFLGMGNREYVSPETEAENDDNGNSENEYKPHLCTSNELLRNPKLVRAAICFHADRYVEFTQDGYDALAWSEIDNMQEILDVIRP